MCLKGVCILRCYNFNFYQGGRFLFFCVFGVSLKGLDLTAFSAFQWIYIMLMFKKNKYEHRFLTVNVNILQVYRGFI